MRLDILLGGNVILSDSMFFDGVYFQSLFLHEKRKQDFIQFLQLLVIGNQPSLIEIRQRGNNVKNSLHKILYKKDGLAGFVLSSISKPYIKGEVAKVLAKVQCNKIEYQDVDTFLSACIEYAEDGIIKDEFKQKIDIFNSFSEIPGNVFRTWEPNFNFPIVLKDAMDNRRFRIELSNDRVIDDVILLIEKEVQKQYPDRSLIQQEIARKTNIFNSPPTNKAERVLERIWGQFLQVYNRTIGIQHRCDTFDIGEIQYGMDNFDIEISAGLNQDTLQALAKCSWEEFGLKFNELSSYRREWLDAIWDLENEKENTTYRVRKALESYAEAIMKKYKTKPTWNDFVELIGGGASPDIDIMGASNLSFLPGRSLLKLPVEVKNLGKKYFEFRKEKNNIIELGQKFIPF